LRIGIHGGSLGIGIHHEAFVGLRRRRFSQADKRRTLVPRGAVVVLIFCGKGGVHLVGTVVFIVSA
jgi:hypothetical protein